MEFGVRFIEGLCACMRGVTRVYDFIFPRILCCFRRSLVAGVVQWLRVTHGIQQDCFVGESCHSNVPCSPWWLWVQQTKHSVKHTMDVKSLQQRADEVSDASRGHAIFSGIELLA